MLPYVSIFEYIHKQVEHNINTQESILEVYKYSELTSTNR